jgi:methylamine dehydrogenase heavy chain
MAARQVLAGAVGGALLLLGGVTQAQEQVETLGVAPFPPGTPERLWVLDLAFNHLVDGRLQIVDPKAGKFLGQVSTGFTGFATFSPDGSKLYVATTYYDRLTRGNKHDVLETYDVRTLAFEGEIELPPKRAMVITYKDMIGITADGRFAVVQNSTPASSVTVVDLQGKKVAAEIDTAGCWSVVASTTAPRRFATVCGDGTLESIELDETGQQASRHKSQPMFDPDEDPIFIQSDAIADVHFWVSFKGKVVSADLSRPEPQVDEAWDFVAGTEGNWRPGGYNPVAIHTLTGRMFVGMHSNGTEGSHKNPGEEIWTLDLAGKKVTGHAPGHEALAVNVTQTDQPLVYALQLGTNVVMLDPKNGMAEVGRMEGVAETATFAMVR